MNFNNNYITHKIKMHPLESEFKFLQNILLFGQLISFVVAHITTCTERIIII